MNYYFEYAYMKRRKDTYNDAILIVDENDDILFSVDVAPTDSNLKGLNEAGRRGWRVKHPEGDKILLERKVVVNHELGSC